jgi:hypothetical protein
MGFAAAAVLGAPTIENDAFAVAVDFGAIVVVGVGRAAAGAGADFAGAGESKVPPNIEEAAAAETGLVAEAAGIAAAAMVVAGVAAVSVGAGAADMLFKSICK